MAGRRRADCGDGDQTLEAHVVADDVDLARIEGTLEALLEVARSSATAPSRNTPAGASVKSARACPRAGP